MKATRREFLAAGGALAAFASLARCAGASGADRGARVPLESLEGGARRTVLVRGRPVEVRRDGEAIVATSLVCTHMGCVVRWDEGAGQYLCPCHDGRFDRDGAVVAGPPPRGLDRVPVAVEGAEAVFE